MDLVGTVPREDDNVVAAPVVQRTAELLGRAVPPPVALAQRRARFRRRRRRDTVREWLGMAIVAAVGLWVAVAAVAVALGR